MLLVFKVIPFDIKIDSDTAKGTDTDSKGSKKDKQQSVFESDEQKIMKILNGLNQDDSTKKKQEDESPKEIVKEIRSAYVELGEIINGVEQDEGIKTEKKGDGEEEGEEDDEEAKERKKKKEKNEQKEEEKKIKNSNDVGNKKKKRKNSGNDDNDDDDEEDNEDNEDSDYNPYDDSKPKRKKKKKKPLTRKDHLSKVLSYLKKAEDQLKLIGGKRVKSATQTPKDEDADTRVHKENTDWKMLATKLARQLGLVLKKMAEKDQKLLVEKTRLQGVLASLAQTEAQKNHETQTRGDDDDDDDDEYNDEDRSKIIHSMATKLLSFSRTVHEAQIDNHLRTPRKKKRILHNLVSRYRHLVSKILANWVKLRGRGKKKSGIPKQGKGALSAKRGDITRSKGNTTTKASHGNIATPSIINKTPQKIKIAIKKKGDVSSKTTDTTASKDVDIKTVTDGEQDVLEVANK